jgi:hypothetical protein
MLFGPHSFSVRASVEKPLRLKTTAPAALTTLI